MADIFDQIYQIIEETGKKHPGTLGRNEVMEAFFRDVPVKAVPAPVSAPAAASVPAAAVDSTDENISAAKEFNSLDELRDSLAGCCRCALHRQRNTIVFGEGDPQAKLMFIGEGPGFEEDRSGRPFVGKAGQLLDKMISAMQFSRQEVYIANIVKCRPPDNRAPAPEEAECCMPFLKMQIDLIRPEVIVLLGAVAVKYLLGVSTGITRMRGRWTSFENIPVMPTFHPAFLLRQESAKKEAWQDLQQVMARFGKFHRK